MGILQKFLKLSPHSLRFLSADVPLDCVASVTQEMGSTKGYSSHANPLQLGFEVLAMIWQRSALRDDIFKMESFANKCPGRGCLLICDR